MNGIFLALLILSAEVQNKFSVVELGVGYLFIPESPSFAISEMTFAEFQDYKLIPPLGPMNMIFSIGGAKLFPALLLDREDRTFEFVRQIRFLPGGGILPISVILWSPKALFTFFQGGEGELKLMPYLRFQLIPISDTLIMSIFNPELFTKKVYSPGPFPHFEISTGMRGEVKSFGFELKLGMRTYALFVPLLTRQEAEAIEKYRQTGVKRIVGKEYSSKYGFSFFINLGMGINVPSYYITKIVTREEIKVQQTAEVEELKKKLLELEKKLAQVAVEEKKKEKRAEAEKRPAEKREPEKKPEVASVKVTYDVEKKEELDFLGSEILSADSYKNGMLHLSWRVPLSKQNIDKVVLERCLGYNCENFYEVSSFPSNITSYADQIVENQIYCYRLVVKMKLKEEEKLPEKVKEKKQRIVRSGKLCTYVSFKGDLIKVYF